MEGRRLLLFLLILGFSSAFDSGIGFISHFGRASRDNCYRKVRSHLKLRDLHVTEDILTNSLSECEDRCRRARFECRSFSYKHNYLSRYRENCLLSREDTRTLNIVSKLDFETDDDFDFYEQENRYNCRPGREGSLHFGLSNYDNCFRMTRSRQRLSSHRDIRRSLSALNKEDCERSCLNQRSFICRAFFYKHSYGGGRNTYFLREDNCHLISQDLGRSRSLFHFPNNDYFDYYERMDYRGSCDSHSHTYTSIGREDKGYYNDYYYGSDDSDDCFQLEKKGFRFDRIATRERISARNLQDCQYECMMARSFVCRAIAFSRYSLSGSTFSGENCHLSDADMQSRISTYDTISDSKFDIYAKDDSFYGRCRGGGSGRRFGRESYIGADGGGYETVKGVRCNRQCRLDRFSRYFFCEIDYEGNWDYCCRPGSRCTYDPQVQFDRCEVGYKGGDQWRTCYEAHGNTLLRRAFLEDKGNSTVDNNQIKEKGKHFKTQKPAKTVEVLDIKNIIN